MHVVYRELPGGPGRSRGVSVLVLLGALALGLLSLVLFVPLLLIAAVVGLGAAAAVWARRRVARMRAPNGALDGRRNVRVRLPGDA